MNAQVGLAVIYRWRLHPVKEAQFTQGWERATQLYVRTRGALGSRLHQADDGTWVAYAQWPTRAAWEQSRAAGSPDPEAAGLMRDAEAETYPPLLWPSCRTTCCWAPSSRGSSQHLQATHSSGGIMGQMVAVVYRPKAGRADALLGLIREHVPMLRSEGLATERAPLVMRAADGTLVEIFEWESPEAITRAHSNPTLLGLWGRFGECCEYGTLASLPEAQRPFSPFQLVTL